MDNDAGGHLCRGRRQGSMPARAKVSSKHLPAALSSFPTYRTTEDHSYLDKFSTAAVRVLGCVLHLPRKCHHERISWRAVSLNGLHKGTYGHVQDLVQGYSVPQK